jgi:IS30 family transposase
MVMPAPIRTPGVRVRAFWRARLSGMAIVDAAALAGVSPRAGKQWINQAGGVIPDLVEPTGRHLSLTEREEIAVGWAAGLSRAEIARKLGRHPATVGRELHRNKLVGPEPLAPRADGVAHKPGPKPGRAPRAQHEQLRYRAVVAQAKAEQRARRPKPRKLARCPQLLAQVRAGLAQWWSPQQISATLQLSFPGQAEMQVSHETIYQELYVQGRGELRRELTRCLRTGRAVRRPRRMADRRTTRRIPDMILISQRPAEVTDRAVPGHWEGDLIIGAGSGSAIGTLVERTTRFVMLLHLPGQHGAEQVRDAMITTMGALPAALRRSLTWDQGIELTRHAEIGVALDLPIYFCDPHSPWQRGSNENTNGLLRQYFPKATDLSQHSPADLAAVSAQLNARPRKTLGWATPAHALAQLLSRPLTTGVATTP